ncbi:MAG: YfiR family protein [Candidatus Acidiferrales bacterium]
MAVVPLGPTLSALAISEQDSRPPSEAQIKAAFLLNFARFAEWSPMAVPETSTLLFFCFDGAEDVRIAFQTLADGKEIGKRKIVNRKITSPADARTCQAVFANDSKHNREAELLKTARDVGALTVGDGPDFLSSGGMIQLLVDDNRMRFDINMATVSRAKIKLSSKLLALARHVVDLPAEAAN